MCVRLQHWRRLARVQEARIPLRRMYGELDQEHLRRLVEESNS